MTSAQAYLQEREITPQTITENKVVICDNVLARDYWIALGFDQWHSGLLNEIVQESIWFACVDSKGNRQSCILRPFPALPGKNGDGPVKFLTPKDGNNYPYIPKATWKVAQSLKHPFVITEGPCKGLAILQCGGFPVATNGVWMASIVNQFGATELHPAFLDFKLRARTIYIAFDADFASNPNVRHALVRAAVLLHKQGAEVKILTWPASDGKGIDDFLVNKSNGSQALEQLCAEACDLGGAIRPCDLEFVESEMGRARLRGSKLHQLCRIVGPKLEVSTDILKDEVTATYEEEQLASNLDEPWPDKVDGAALADDLVKVITRHVIMGESQAKAITLWIFLTYIEAAVNILPMLAILSPVKRCGKTTLLSLLLKLVSKPLPASNCSTASLYRIIHAIHPTLLIDEVDAWLAGNEECRGVLNSGHARELAFVLRCNDDSNQPERFSTWAPKVLAGIGKLADTLTDRSVTIALERRKKTQKITKLRDTDPREFIQFRQKLLRWASDNLDDLRDARPTIPDALNDREGDNWSVLLAIAETFNENWKRTAQQMALSLSGSDDEAVYILLLSKLQEVLEDYKKDHVPTWCLHEKLNEDKGLPWGDWSNGRGLTETKLAAILKTFGVKPDRAWDGAKKAMGYWKKDLQPVFDRYLPQK